MDAYLELQSGLMENIALLVPFVVSLKDLLAAVTNIEEMLEGKSADGGTTPTELVRDWLNSKEESTQ